jgi:type IV secretion system protein VirB6
MITILGNFLFNTRQLKTFELRLAHCFKLLMLLALASCGSDRCIDADDFGFPKVYISARYPTKDMTVTGADSKPVTFTPILESQGKQVGAWIDSGYKLNGEPLTIMVKNWKYDKLKSNNTGGLLSAWSPWFGTAQQYNLLPNYLLNLRTCKFKNDDPCANAPTPPQRILNAPCLMTQGVGLYGLVVKPHAGNKTDPIYDPNSTVAERSNPSQGYTFHVGDPKNRTTAKLYDINQAYTIGEQKNVTSSLAGGIMLNKETGVDIKDYNGGNLYFKIQDIDYSDNAGQYIAVIKSGVRNLGFDPFDTLAKQFKYMFFGSRGATDVLINIPGNGDGIVPGIYGGIIKNSGYLKFVNALLILYIMFTGMGFLIGLFKFTQFELFVRIFKVLVISVLISEGSWSFFNEYFFGFFIDGIDEINTMLNQSMSSGGESIIALIFAEQTLAKLLSLILTDGSGLLYFILFFLVMCVVVVMYLKAYILYLTALFLVAIIIAIAPIFFCFMLFGMTRSLFDNWLSKLISYSFQPIILFASLAILGGMVRDEIYNSLGFKVCQLPIIDIGITPEPLLAMYYPQPKSPEYFDNKLTNISLPKPYTTYKADGKTVDKTYKAYENTGDRYLDLPFLDPNMPESQGDDKARIQKFKDKGVFVQFDGLIYLILLTWVMFYFNESTVAIADAIFNNVGSATDIGRITDNIGFNTVEAFGRHMQNSFNAKMRESAVGRTMISGYEVLKAGAAKIESMAENSLNSYSNFLRNPAASLASTEANEEFAKKHGFIAKVMGVKSTLEERAERNQKSAESSLRLEKALSDFGYNAHDNLKDAKNYAYGTMKDAGNFISNIPNKAKGAAEYTSGKFQNAMQYANNVFSKGSPSFDPKTGRTYQSNQSIYDPNSTAGSGGLFQPRVVHMNNSYKSGRSFADSNNLSGTTSQSQNYKSGLTAYNTPKQTPGAGNASSSIKQSVESIRERLGQVNYRNLILDGMISLLKEENDSDREKFAEERAKKEKADREKKKHDSENWAEERGQANERFAAERQKIKDDESIVDKRSAIKDLRNQRDAELSGIREKYDPNRGLKENLAKGKELQLQEKDIKSREKDLKEKIKNRYDPEKNLDENLAKRKEVNLEKEKFDEDRKKFLLEKKKLMAERRKLHKDY